MLNYVTIITLMDPLHLVDDCLSNFRADGGNKSMYSKILTCTYSPELLYLAQSGTRFLEMKPNVSLVEYLP